MALTQVNSDGMKDDSIKNADIKSDAAIASTKLGDLPAAKITSGTIATARLGSQTANSSTFLRGDGSWQAVTEYNDDVVQSNIAMLGFKVATNGSLTKYNLVDQVIDDYNDASGVDAGASTNEVLAGGAYSGGSVNAPTGGTVTTHGSYTVHTFPTGSTNFVVPSAGTVSHLMVAGGGSGGRDVNNDVGAGGGGAGGVIVTASQSVTAQTYSIVVGGGAAEKSSSPGGDGLGNNGANTTAFGLTAVGGGGGGGSNGAAAGAAGGSGGGSRNGGTAGAGTAGQGNAGGVGGNNPNGGGGGAGEAGNTDSSGHGGDGIDNNYQTGSNITYGGGGGGGRKVDSGNTTGGTGGGGDGGAGANGVAGTNGRGGGGGGAGGLYIGGAGGDGVVIVRYTTGSFTTYSDLTLQSTATTASAAPTKADLIVLIENSEGTATVNTDVKGYISRDGSAFSSAVTFVDEGTWGTNKKIYAAHDVDISGITSGTSMKYKITTHNQAAGSKVTKIHGTSLGWR